MRVDEARREGERERERGAPPPIPGAEVKKSSPQITAHNGPDCVYHAHPSLPPSNPLTNYPACSSDRGGGGWGGGGGGGGGVVNGRSGERVAVEGEEIYCRKWVYSTAVCGACMEIRDRLPRKGPSSQKPKGIRTRRQFDGEGRGGEGWIGNGREKRRGWKVKM